MSDCGLATTLDTPCKPRLRYIDAAKAIAITLVVIGHVAREAPQGNAWYDVVKAFLYKFHMPLFMFVSGLVAQYASRQISGVAGYLRHVKQIAVRFGLPYIAFALLALAGKRFLGHYVALDNMPESLGEGAFALFVTPLQSCFGQLWYLYVLSEYLILLPIVTGLLGRRAWLVIPIAAVAYWWRPTDWFAANLLFEYGLFFSCGCWAGRYPELFESLLQYRGVWCVSFAILCFMSYGVTYAVPFALPYAASKLTLGLSSVLAVCSASIIVQDNRVLRVIGQSTFVIYLLHAPTLALLRVLARAYGLWGGAWFLFLFPVMTTAGIWLPLLLRYGLLRLHRQRTIAAYVCSRRLG